MVPHALFVRSDRRFDVALNLLTVLVGGALLATLAYVVFIWLRSPPALADRGDVGPPAWAAMSDVLLKPSRREHFDLPLPRVELELPLPYGLAIYRCESGGDVSYSDRPCTTGRVRQLSIRRF